MGFERMVSVSLGRFMEHNGALPPTQFAYWKGLGTCDAPLCLFHALPCTLESWLEARIVQVDFSAVIDTVDQQEILKHCSVGIGGSLLPMDTVLSIDKSITARYDGRLQE